MYIKYYIEMQNKLFILHHTEMGDCITPFSAKSGTLNLI